MAYSANPGSVAAEFGGKHYQDYKMGFDLSSSTQNNDRGAVVVDENLPKDSPYRGGRGSEPSASEEEEEEEEEDEPDSSGEKEDDETDAEIMAPSRGVGLGKGKRPAIHIHKAEDDESEEDTQQAPARGTGKNISKHPVGQLLMRNKKRTYSNVSNSSVLFGDAGHLNPEQGGFPRRKLARKLSSNSDNGLLAYQKDTNNESPDAPENALEDSDDEQEAKTNDIDIDIDDEDYSGVNLISEESDVEEIEQQEEEWLINDAEQSTELFNDARRLSLDSVNDSYFGRGGGFSESHFLENVFPDVGFGEFFEPDPQPMSPEPTRPRKVSDASAKRVRFDDEVNMSGSSSSSESELDTSLWPDLFEKDKLPANVYRMIESDNVDFDNGDYESDASERSFWDYEEAGGFSHPDAFDELDDDSSEAGSSGYETDMGDTTDEYDSDFASPAPQTPQQKSVLRRPASAPGSKAASPVPYQRSSKPTGRIIPPVCGVFIHEERNEAIAVTNRTTKTIAFYRPRTTPSIRRGQYVASSTTSTAQNSPRASLHHFNAEDSDFNDAFAFNATDIMFTTDVMQFLGVSTDGPPEAFYQHVNIDQNGQMTILSDEEDHEFDDDDEDEFGEDVNIEEFMNFGPEGDATDVEQEESTDAPATPATSMLALPSSTPAHPTPMANDMTPTNRRRTNPDAYLEHFDRGVVTAFRNNQNYHRSLARLPYDPDLRASVSRPLRSGGSAETLMSPLRKRSSIAKKMKGSGFTGITKNTGRLGAINGPRGPRMGTFS
ncbi:hypothetical protein GQ43DRAFT_100303 [Delitschia confertaspora ATCC 74209]|uniref:Uncharacterized protein n=1 Tax=Delitschia confertaspora ATCC 74209 TaxID=1513339 RepID=A0A9P4JIK9_9PLEO|nr:hypothetical protein GQ43DRAFT_100303 [Delitschia confertaspora ATCC 74209]